MPTFPLLDLEATANQLHYHQIIQIPITFLPHNQVIHTYHSIIPTHLQIPPFIQPLTSIQQQILLHPPYFNHLPHHIYQLIKDSIFLPHNVSFHLN
ncbi:exonuclease domain-containing protein, partial [Staphylococcus epidermidis]|uniref:exonuclease domain-containing protein n=1 Tax=Staphylococcus epidermidis TaxID=1282 RepID=UPI0037D9BDDA